MIVKLTEKKHSKLDKKINSRMKADKF